MLASSKASAFGARSAMIRSETSAYSLRLPGMKTVAGSPRRRAASASRQAREMGIADRMRSEEHTSELQSLTNLVCRLLLEKKKQHRLPVAHRLRLLVTALEQRR